MSTALAEDSSGQETPEGMSVSYTDEVRSPAFSIVTALQEQVTNGGKQLTLALTTGYHVGPLFIVQKKRAPIIHGGTLGGKRRRNREKRNTPEWADRSKITAIYREAVRLTKETGEQHVVDHIVPLDGKIVCGLHWHENMRVIHWLENSKKGWGWWPDMPFEQLELI